MLYLVELVDGRAGRVDGARGHGQPEVAPRDGALLQQDTEGSPP